MMLRASGQEKQSNVDIGVLTHQSEGDGGIPHGRLIIELVDAVLDDAADPAPARQCLEVAAGREAVIDTAGVIAMFHLNDRIADATGTPLDKFGLEMRLAIGDELGVSQVS